jgi:conjugative relaxase-like TrwC/TraI family protein
MLSDVLIIRGIRPDALYYYIHGREGTATGHWWGHCCPALGLDGEVNAGDLRRVLQGRHPGDGHFLPDHRPARRRAGWDLVFSAPKSVSLLWALQPDTEAVAASHRSAVEGVMGYLETSMLSVRRVSAVSGRAPARGAVAALFQHNSNAAAEPHLHTHVLLANLTQTDDGHWAPASGSQWQVCRKGLFALYQLELRHHLAQTGFKLPWRIRPDGTADLADVPRAAIRAASTQRWSVEAIGRFETRRRAMPQPWRERSTLSGFGADDAARAARQGEGLPAPGRDGLAEAVTERLLIQSSEFRAADVWAAVAVCDPEGMIAVDATGWSESFCGEAIEVRTPRSTPRWTTARARAADDMLLRQSVWPLRGANAGAEMAASVARDAGLPPGASRALDRLATSDQPVQIVAAPPGVSGLLERAELLGAGMSAWEAAGLRVAITCRRPADAVRWHTLIGVTSYRPGRPVDVLLVDQADRRPTPELVALLASARTAGARAILVEGGTLPRLTDPASRGLIELTRRVQPVELGQTAPAPAALRLAPIRDLVSEWSRRAGQEATLVGLGPDEVQGLNQTARSILQGKGVLTGPPTIAAGREFKRGDRVESLRGRGSIPARGALGEVTGVADRPPRIAVRWDDGSRSVVAGAELRYLGYGYAATPALAARGRGPLLLLGPEGAVSSLRGRIVTSLRAGYGPERGTGAGLEPATAVLNRDAQTPVLSM